MQSTLSRCLLSFALTLVACGDDEDEPAACNCIVRPACSIDTQVANRASSEKTLDCGNLPLTTDSAARAAADRCVLDAQSVGRPFKLIAWMQGTDSNLAYGYISKGGQGAAVSILQYDSAFSQFSSTGGGSIAIRTCSSLREVASCQPDSSTFCLECVDESELSKVCEEPPQRST